MDIIELGDCLTNEFKKENIKPISEALLDKAWINIGHKCRSIPFKTRGIYINRELVRVTIEILNNEPSKKLPQNCKNSIAEEQLDGLDKRIKIVRNNDTRTANIISDVLADVEIVKIIKIINPPTGNIVKGTQLEEAWTW